MEGGQRMFALKIVLEVLAVLLLAYGFWHEEEIIAWEDKQVKKIKEAHHDKS